MDDLDEIIKEFLVESYENLDQLDRDLMALEDSPDDRNRLSSVFRTIHTIKGTCGFLGFPILEHVTHVGESLLVRLRDGELRLNGVITTGLLTMVDAVRTVLSNIANTNTEGDNHYEALVEHLDQLRLGQAMEAEVAVAVAEKPSSSGSGTVDLSDVEDRVEAIVDDLEEMVADLTVTQKKSSSKKSKKPAATKSPAVAKAKPTSEPKTKPAPKAKATKAKKSKPSLGPALTEMTPTEVEVPQVTPVVVEHVVTAKPVTTKATTQKSTSKKASKPKAETKPSPKVKSTTKPLTEKTPKSAPKKGSPKTVEVTSKKVVEHELIETAVEPAITTPTMTEPVLVSATSIPEPKSAATPAPKQSVAASTSPTDGEIHSESGEKNQAVAETTVRLDVSLLDRLMNLVGELVLARNQIVQFSLTTQDAALIAASQRLNLITTELQEGVMKTRMQPIRNAWNKLPRVVRDLSQTCGKKVNVEMEGADTELDKTILEAIKDPLTHIVRNSVDHGIEPPEVRVANGKPAEGTLWLKAFHEGGQVNIEISDDGGGIHLDRVRAKGIEKGLITEEQAAGMSDREVMNLILLPGFSTAAKVTNVSGRGVGMDVVKTNVERIGGTLDINSVQGAGTTLRIKIPLTLAIAPALTVMSGGSRYCIPQVNLQELVRLERDRVRNEIELIHSVPVYRLRGQLLPLLYLDEELNLRPRRTHAERKNEERVQIVVLQAEDQQFGLIVDSIIDTQEIVVKPLGHHLKGLRAYAGATIMGDGTISLILDVIGLAQQGLVLNQHREHAASTHGGHHLEGEDVQTWLVVDPGDGSQAAIQLASVARLEEFQLSDIEHSGPDEVVQYRGEILPLVRLGGGFESMPHGDWDQGKRSKIRKDSVSVVVHQAAGRQVGIVVGHIVDIVEHSPRVGGDDANIWNQSQIINGRVTRLVDLAALVGSAI